MSDLYELPRLCFAGRQSAAGFRNHKANTFRALVSTVGAEAMLDTSFGVLFQNTGRTAPSRRSPW